MIDLVTIEFVSVVQSGGIRKAAGKMFISPSSLSRHISSLESKCRCKLIERVHPLELTKEGELYYRYALQAIDLYREFESDLSGYEIAINTNKTTYHAS